LFRGRGFDDEGTARNGCDDRREEDVIVIEAFSRDYQLDMYRARLRSVLEDEEVASEALQNVMDGWMECAIRVILKIRPDDKETNTRGKTHVLGIPILVSICNTVSTRVM
jgi:hypothetical protein